jgi:hypothetical protein
VQPFPSGTQSRLKEVPATTRVDMHFKGSYNGLFFITMMFLQLPFVFILMCVFSVIQVLSVKETMVSV